MIEIFPGKDNVVISAKVKTSKDIVLRPIQRLHDLVITDCSGNTDEKGR